MYNKLTQLLNEYIPKICIDSDWMDNGHFRHLLVSTDLKTDLEVRKNSYVISFIKFNGPNDLFGKEFCRFKIITYISSSDDTLAVSNTMENYDPLVKYNFSEVNFIQNSKTSLRKNNNLYIRTSHDENTEDFCIYRDENWNSYFIPRGMTEEEYFQNSMQLDLPPYYFFENIYKLNEVETYSADHTSNLGKVFDLDLYDVCNIEEYFEDLESCLRFLVNLTGRLDEFRTY